ncbi:adipocyte plasma membrane-associated protein Hemomucin [Condylostylus longicornis]|uniref:adipocyte plasma membrane-associated protein Hemomucin n=1 Tax=Condylostylus longicornis TaxID=2530218 RepID=UPI00244DC16C|nr:adipocyte plasma membrane-associated protein Hemomucin [Condylostylus longicornis]
MGLLYNLFVRLVNFAVFFLLIVLIPGLPPNTYFPFTSIELKPQRELKGPLALNNLLDNGERLLEGRVHGPEALLARKDEVYTGIQGGEIVKITADRIRHVAKFGPPCEGVYEESKCGRPLGLAFDTLGNNLIAADAYYGIWEIDLSNGKKKLLVSPNQEFDGTDGKKRMGKVFNSVAVAKNGDIYWTDSSSDFALSDGILASFSNPSGRLFHYDRSKNVSSLLIDELHFANGVALSPNEDFVVVAETVSSRLLKYHLKGSKKGQYEVFLDGLPGLPDNLTPDSDGLWVPLVAAADSEHPQIMQLLSPYPIVRLFVVRFLALIQLPFRFFNNLIPIPLAQKTLHLIGNFESVTFLYPSRSTILRLDWNGNILGSLHGFDRSVGFVSHVLELDDSLLLGSPFNKFLARVKLPRAAQVKIRNVRYEGAIDMEPIVVERKQQAPEAQKAVPSTTTTTAKPTTTTTKNPSTKTPKVTTTPKPVTSTPSNPKSSDTGAKSASPTTAKPTTNNPNAREDPAPILENIPVDAKPPKNEKLKVIKKGGVHGEL